MNDPAAPAPTPSTPVVAILPLRGRSQRVPGKNRRPLAGRPLYHHILTTLHGVAEIGSIVVNSDDPDLLEEAAAAFPGIIPLRRPDRLAAPEASMNAVLCDTLDRLSPDANTVLLQTHATNPFLSVETISAAIAAFRSAGHVCDSLFSVTRRHVRLWDSTGRAINHDPARLLPTQDLPAVFEENSCLYLFTAASLRRLGTRIGARPRLFETPPLDSLDIDEESDFTVAEALAQSRAFAQSQSESDACTGIGTGPPGQPL